MTPDQKWERQKVKLKLMFPQLHDDDLYYDYGQGSLTISRWNQGGPTYCSKNYFVYKTNK